MEQMTGPLRRIDRAKEYLDVLNDEIRSFITSQPYRASIQKHFQEGYYILYPYLARPHSIEWGLLIGAFAHELRSSLDNISWAVAVKRDTNTSFPIFLDRNKKFVGLLERLQEDVRTDIEAVQPYKATKGQERKHSLWILNVINIIDKHRLILPITTRIQVSTGLSSPKWAYIDGINPRNKGDVELRMSLPPNAQDDFEPQVIGQIGFDISSPLPGEADNPPRIRLSDLFKIHHFVRNDVYPRFADLLQLEDRSS